MKLSPIVQRLRVHCPSFDQRVVAGARFLPPSETSAFAVPAAWVIPLKDRPAPVLDRNQYRQDVRDGFSVIVALENAGDPLGGNAIERVHDLRTEIWKALLGWEPATNYGWIEFEGGQVLHMDAARLYHQFDFGTSTFIAYADTAQAVEHDALPFLTEVDLTVDARDPADPNLGQPGPDGRPEARALFTIPTT